MDEILELYSEIYGVQFIARLGEGKDGEVFQTDAMTAVKFPSSGDYFERDDEELERLDFTDVRVFGSTLRTRLESAAELGVF